jgi:N-acetylglucosaminyldiphosphoundecaprenol N-acetyl-beta-D-mannosaminyltransferase
LFDAALNKQKIFTQIKERLTGRMLIYDLAFMSAQNNFSLALAGGRGGVAEQAAEILKSLNPGLKVNLEQSDCDFDQALVDKISKSNSDILLIAYQPPVQEIWLNQNAGRFNVNLTVGLGGTFDYLSSKAVIPPDIMHKFGLEWLWRFITQPNRIKRIWNATFVFLKTVLIYKLRSLK